MTVVTRFPPSPTGYLHIGGARTALFNWLYARGRGGELVLRIEDTDIERSTPEAVEEIMKSMEWLGLGWNRGPYFQTRRFNRYEEVIGQLLEKGQAYHCFCSRKRLDDLRERQRQRGEKPRYDHHCRDLGRTPEEGESSVVRFRNPLDGAVVFEDVVRGRVEISNHELDDMVIARSDGSPTYNLTVVVDDADMGITHVIRGDDHTSNTPRQINIFHALGAPPPVFAHVPLIHGQDGQKLSKRHGAASVLEFRNMGILPEALLNYLVRLGWSHGDQEIFDLDAMIDLFDIKDINRSAASFDPEKLLWLNQHYIRQADTARLGNELAARLHARGLRLREGPRVSEAVEVLRDRVQTLEQMAEQSRYLYAEPESHDPKAAKHLVPEAVPRLAALAKGLEVLDDWTADNINAAIKAVVTDLGVRFPDVALPLRVALSGGTSTPPIDVTTRLVGKTRTLNRIRRAIGTIESGTASG